jgi:hypothetical protein
MPEGISQHLKVIDRDTEEEVKSVIILDPVNDRHARAGLIGYAESVEHTKPELAFKIKRLISRLDEVDQTQRQRLQLPEDPAVQAFIDWIRTMPRNESDNDSESNA